MNDRPPNRQTGAAAAAKAPSANGLSAKALSAKGLSASPLSAGPVSPGPLAPSPARSDGSMAPVVPALLRAYMVAHQVAPGSVLPDGRLGLSFDGRWRVQVRPLSDGRLLLSAAVLDVADRSGPAREELLVALAGYATGVMRDHESGLALDEEAGRLLLHQQVAADASLFKLESALGDFVNMLSFWTGSARMEAARRQATLSRG